MICYTGDHAGRDEHISPLCRCPTTDPLNSFTQSDGSYTSAEPIEIYTSPLSGLTLANAYRIWVSLSAGRS